MCQLIYLFKVALALYLFHKLVCYVTCYNFAIWRQHHGHTKCIVASINTWKQTSRQKQLPWLSHSNLENKQYGTEVERNTDKMRNLEFRVLKMPDDWAEKQLIIRPYGPRALFSGPTIYRKRSRMGVVRVQTLKIDGCQLITDRNKMVIWKTATELIDRVRSSRAGWENVGSRSARPDLEPNFFLS